jgi:hypothetical protein
MNKQARRRWILTIFLCVAILLMLSGCVLTTEVIITVPVYPSYSCRATLVNTSTGERRVLNSSMLGSITPRPPGRTFINFDWDDDNDNDESDVRLDWRRYLSQSILTSTGFAGRSWCVDPNEISCTRGADLVFRMGLPGALPSDTPPDCTAAAGAHLEVTAPGLTPDNQVSFPDTPVGETTAPVTFTVTNRSAVAVRVNAVAFSGGAGAVDFVKSADSCQPTSTEMTAGRGHLLAASGTCTFQLEFRPQHRDGVPECNAASPSDVCRRRGMLAVTGEVDLSRSALTTVSVGVSGRAIGGGIVTEPTEICFPTAPALGTCTAYRNLRILNNSTGALTLTSARLTRAGNRFEATMPFLMPITVPPGLLFDVPVRFCNVADDPTDGEFTINSSSPINPTTVVTLVNPLRRVCP